MKYKLLIILAVFAVTSCREDNPALDDKDEKVAKEVVYFALSTDKRVMVKEYNEEGAQVGSITYRRDGYNKVTLDENGRMITRVISSDDLKQIITYKYTDGVVDGFSIGKVYLNDSLVSLVDNFIAEEKRISVFRDLNNNLVEIASSEFNDRGELLKEITVNSNWDTVLFANYYFGETKKLNSVVTVDYEGEIIIKDEFIYRGEKIDTVYNTTLDMRSEKLLLQDTLFVKYSYY